MSEMMRKTKQELIEYIQEIETQLSHLKEKNAVIEDEKASLDAAVANHRREQQEFHDQLSDIRTVVDSLRAEGDAAKKTAVGMEKEKTQLETAIAQLQKDHRELQAKMHGVQTELDRLRLKDEAANNEMAVLRETNDVITRENTELTTIRSELEKTLMKTRERLEQYESRYHSGQELFRSIVDDDAKKLLLIDTAYAVIYASRSARSAMRIAENANIAGKRFFNFIVFNDATKVKEKIDKVFLDGGKEKIKKVKLCCEDGSVGEVKLKMDRVRHQDRPCVRIVIK